MALQRTFGSSNVQIAHVENSTVTISIDGGPHRLVPLDPAWIELPAPVTSPARMLRARYGVIPYVPPGDLADRLERWAHDPAPFALRVVAGTAGAGKTRIAIELCRSLAQLGWLTGLLKARIDPEQLDLLADAGTARLVVIDYAETRLEQLADVLPDLARQATKDHPLRILLTIRSRATSVEDVRLVLYGRGDALDVVIDRAAVDLLSEVPFGAAERARLTAIAVEAISRRLGREAPPGAAPAAVGRELTTPLLVLIACYLAVVDGEVPSTRTELLDGLLRHEDRYWSKMAEAVGLSVDETLRRRVAAFAALAGTGAGEAEAHAARLLRLVPDLSETIEERRRALARWTRDLYPGVAWWNAMEPDLIGEHLVASTYGAQPEVLAGVLTNRPPDALAQVLRLLARAARDHATIAATLREVLNERLAELCDLAVEQASGVEAPRLLRAGTTVAAALESLISLAPPDPRQLPNLLDRFPRSNTVLAHLALELTSQAVDHYRRLAAASPADLAITLNNFGIRLSEIGQRESACHATQEAVNMFRRLDRTNPAAFDSELAMALNNLSVDLSSLHRLQDALHAAAEAVEVYRRLAASDNAFEPGLALALDNLGGRLSDLNRGERALDAGDEAVEIARRLPAAIFEPDLASLLSNHGGRLSRFGRRKRALEVTEEAVAILRRLAAANPAAFEPRLAESLLNLGAGLAERGDLETALQIAEETVAISRRLAAANPAAFAAGLARALHNLSLRLEEQAQFELAAQAATEAVEITRGLAATNPDAFEVDLARDLDNLGGRLSRLGRLDRALHTTRESVEIYRRRTADGAGPLQRELAQALNNLGGRLWEVGDYELALEAAKEAVEIYRTLADADPIAFEPDLATLLGNLGIYLSEVKRRDEAVRASTEAVEICRRVADANPSAFEPMLAVELDNLGNRLSQAGAAMPALEASQDSVKILRGLARTNPPAFEPRLAQALTNLGSRLIDIEQWEPALEVTREAVAIRRRLVDVSPGVFNHNLARALRTLSVPLAFVEGREESLAAIDQAIDILDRLAAIHPERFAADRRISDRVRRLLRGIPGKP